MSGAQYVLTAEARTDLVEIWNHNGEDSFDRADELLARLQDSFDGLAQSPGSDITA